MRVLINYYYVLRLTETIYNYNEEQKDKVLHGGIDKRENLH